MDQLDPVAALGRLGAVADGTTLRRICGARQLLVAVADGRAANAFESCLRATALQRRAVRRCWTCPAA